MNKILISIVVLVALIGCATTESKTRNSLPSYEDEYARAVDTSKAIEIAGDARKISKIINDMRRFYDYSGQVYDRPVTNGSHIVMLEFNGLKDIGYPMSGSTQSEILGDCIFNKFARETGIRPGQWFQISIKEYMDEIEFNKATDAFKVYLDPDIYFIGRMEERGVIGTILRNP